MMPDIFSTAVLELVIPHFVQMALAIREKIVPIALLTAPLNALMILIALLCMEVVLIATFVFVLLATALARRMEQHAEDPQHAVGPTFFPTVMAAI